MLKTLQGKLQQYVNQELWDVLVGFRKDREARDQIAVINWIIEKARDVQKNIYFCFIDHIKALDYVDHSQVYRLFLKRWEYQTTLPVFWEICMQVKKQVKTGHGTTNWFKIGKGVHQGYIFSPCLFNIYVEYIIQNAGLDE